MRITKKDLENLIRDLNVLTLNPKEPYTDGKANIGHYCLYGAYGGYELHQICNENGAVITPLNTGFVSKKELYYAIHYFIKGLRYEDIRK